MGVGGPSHVKLAFAEPKLLSHMSEVIWSSLSHMDASCGLQARKG